MAINQLGRTLYESVAEELRERILASEWAAGERLSSEPVLAQEFGVSRSTMRKAIAILASEGLLVVSHGLGTFVQFARAQQTLGRLDTLQSALLAEGFEPRNTIIEFAFVAPSRDIREDLQLDSDSRVLHIRRLHSVADGPIAVVDLAVAEDTGGKWSRQDVESHPLYDLLARSGSPVQTALQTVRAAPADETIADLLEIEVAAPILVGDRLTMTVDGRPIVKARFNFRHDRFEYRVSADAKVPVFPWPRSDIKVQHEEADLPPAEDPDD